MPASTLSRQLTNWRPSVSRALKPCRSRVTFSSWQTCCQTSSTWRAWQPRTRPPSSTGKTQTYLISSKCRSVWRWIGVKPRQQSKMKMTCVLSKDRYAQINLGSEFGYLLSRIIWTPISNISVPPVAGCRDRRQPRDGWELRPLPHHVQAAARGRSGRSSGDIIQRHINEYI